jgi:hypothetical protein
MQKIKVTDYKVIPKPNIILIKDKIRSKIRNVKK